VNPHVKHKICAKYKQVNTLQRSLSEKGSQHSSSYVDSFVSSAPMRALIHNPIMLSKTDILNTSKVATMISTCH
jgi:hypothetical protein